MPLDPWPHNLPTQFTSFVGRQRECDGALEALARTRLLVLTGAGGSGKTRLAIEVAAAQEDRSPDGAWWVDLAPVTLADHVATTLAGVLGVRPPPGETQTRAVTDHLATQQALVVLDNCEHVADGAADLAEALLRHCPHVVVLATSRSPLRVSGESDWQVPPLGLPDTGRPADVARSDAGILFLERAVSVRPDFELNQDNSQAISRICRDVDGLPLALELAAARVRMLSPDQIADGLGDRFRMLTGGPRGAQRRQKTLRASVDWSYDLLTAPERVLFRRLGAFIGGWSLEAVEQVCVGEELEPDDILDLLGSLTDSSLVIVERFPREARYRLLESVRVYALERLAASDEAAVLADRHCDFFLLLAERASPALSTPDVHRWLEALNYESANLGAAIEHAVTHRPEESLRLTVALCGWWRLRGQFQSGQHSLARALDAADPAPGPLRARALWSCGFLARFGGDPDGARRFSQLALEMAEAVDDDWAQASSLYSIASLGIMNAPLAGRPLYTRALQHAHLAGDPWLVLVVLVNTARNYLVTDNYADAERALSDAEAVVDVVGTDGVAQLGSSAAWCAMARGHFDRSLAICARTAEAALELGDPISRSLADMVGAWVELLQGRPDTALERLQSCEAMVVAKGAIISVPTVRIERARALAALGRLDEARGILEVLEAGGAGGGWHHSRTLVALADVLGALGDADGARICAVEALETSRGMGARMRAASAYEVLARLDIAVGTWTEAEAHLHDSLALRIEVDSPVWMPPLLDAFAQVAAGLESPQEAARLLGAARRTRVDLGIVRWPLGAAELETLEQHLCNDSAFAEGMAMTLDETLAWVRRGRGERKRPSSGWESLTPTELQVVELVAEGLTNPQIGGRMFISPGTAKIHLGHIFAKLSVRSRAELAALAVRRTS